MTLRDDGELFALLDERRRLEQHRGRNISRHALIVEIVKGSLRVLRRPALDTESIPPSVPRS
jgi:hypothetical protein